ncbi:hypothetical protein [Streptomyces sp. NPDC001275]
MIGWGRIVYGAVLSAVAAVLIAAVNVRISGPSLVAALIRLDQVGRTDLSPVTRAIAGHLYDRLAGAVQEIIEDPDHRIEADPLKITIDDRARTAGDE